MSVGTYLNNDIPNMVQNNAVIAISGTVSAAIDLQGRGITGFILPSAFTGTAVTFQLSSSLAGTYVACYNAANTQISVTVTANRAYLLDAGDLVGVRYIKLVSGSVEAAERTITLLLRELD